MDHVLYSQALFTHPIRQIVEVVLLLRRQVFSWLVPGGCSAARCHPDCADVGGEAQQDACQIESSGAVHFWCHI